MGLQSHPEGIFRLVRYHHEKGGWGIVELAMDQADISHPTVAVLEMHPNPRSLKFPATLTADALVTSRPFLVSHIFLPL